LNEKSVDNRGGHVSRSNGEAALECVATPSAVLKPRILIAEDDENDFFLMRMALKKAGAERLIKRCANGDEVVHYLGDATQERPAVILLDIKMPLRDGLETLSWIKQREYLRAIPVIMLSSSLMNSDISLALSLGAADYLVKPSTFEKLVELVNRVLKRYVNN
jgi:DNA-binding response OmpR family regulator